MDSTLGRLSSATMFTLLALAFMANSAVGFLAPSVHVARSAHASWDQVRHFDCTSRTSRCHVRSIKGDLHGRSHKGGLTMEIDPHVLRLQAAELGSKLKVRRSTSTENKLEIVRVLASVLKTIRSSRTRTIISYAPVVPSVAPSKYYSCVQVALCYCLSARFERGYRRGGRCWFRSGIILECPRGI